jgi:hypothetical protein
MSEILEDLQWRNVHMGFNEYRFISSEVEWGESHYTLIS